MDLESLRTILPKKTSAWRTSDVEKWLRFIHLEPYIPTFRSLAIDGSNIKGLSQVDLMGELQIHSRIILKKLAAWIPKGLDRFDEHLLASLVEEGDNNSEDLHEPVIKTQLNQDQKT